MRTHIFLETTILLIKITNQLLIIIKTQQSRFSFRSRWGHITYHRCNIYAYFSYILMQEMNEKVTINITYTIFDLSHVLITSPASGSEALQSVCLYVCHTTIYTIPADQSHASILWPDLISPIACQWAWQLFVNRQCLDVAKPTEKVSTLPWTLLGYVLCNYSLFAVLVGKTSGQFYPVLHWVIG